MNQEGIRCGFFNSVNNDRKYDAEDMGRLFEGVISDGVFNTVEPKFEVEAVPETMDLLVNNGKAWFHERYFEIYNPITVSIRPTDVTSRIDAICICINTNDSVRAGSIEVIEGSTSKPQIPAEEGVYYIPIAWVTVGPNDTVSTDLDIESNVGNAYDPVESYRCPYSEPSLDPRRAMYIYEGESVESEPLTGFNVKDFYVQAVTTEPVTSKNIQIFWVTIPLTELGYEGSETIDNDFVKNNIPIIRTTSGLVRENNSVPNTGYIIEGADSNQQDYLLLSPKSYGFQKPYYDYPNGLHIKVGYWRQNNIRPINIADFSFKITILKREEL